MFTENRNYQKGARKILSEPTLEQSMSDYIGMICSAMTGLICSGMLAYFS
jgi:hypothetical protein